MIQENDKDLRDKIFWILDVIQEKIAKTEYLEPFQLITKNRKDIDYRINFLKDVLELGKNPKQTLYYQFIADKDHGLISNPDEVSSKFLSLYQDIKRQGVLDPIPVTRLGTKKIKIRYVLKGKKYWSEFYNETGYQALGGAHRLAIAKYLGYEKIPVKIFSASYLYEITNYTKFIKLKEKKYFEQINALKSKKC